MGKAWIRQEIKKDKLTETVDKAVSLARRNPERTLGVAGAVLAAALVVVFLVARYYEVRTMAWEGLASAETNLRTGENAVAKIEELENQFPTAPATQYASILKGDILYFNGKFAEAAKVYEEALAKAGPETKPFALANLGLSLEAATEHARAAEKIREFLDQYPEHFLAPQAHLNLALAQEALGSPEAKTTYEKIAILYPETEWAREAQERVKSLPPQKVEAAPKP